MYDGKAANEEFEKCLISASKIKYDSNEYKTEIEIDEFKEKAYRETAKRLKRRILGFWRSKKDLGKNEFYKILTEMNIVNDPRQAEKMFDTMLFEKSNKMISYGNSFIGAYIDIIKSFVDIIKSFDFKGNERFRIEKHYEKASDD